LQAELLAAVPDALVLGADGPRLPHILSIAFRGHPSDALLMALDLEGVSASAGSACAAGSLEPSHVIAALGVAPEYATSVVRFSLGRTTSAADIAAAVAIVRRVIGRMETAGV
jgi:cysteine desulfurase